MPATDAKGNAVVRITLDWRDPQHYDRRRPRPCRICGEATNLRDSAGAAACKTCVEGEIEAKVLEFARTLIAATGRPVTARAAGARQLAAAGAEVAG